MMEKWSCPNCDFLVWTDTRSEMQEAIKTHLLAHYSGNLTKADFRISWNCPYCAVEKTMYNKNEAVGKFKSHLYEHVEDRIQTGTHIAKQIDQNGNIRIDIPTETTEADTLRTHFHSQADLVILITANPESRIRLLHDGLADWPTRAIVVGTEGHPFEDGSDLDFSGIPMELVEIDSRLGPSDVGETISRILDVHHDDGMEVSVEVDIVTELINSFDIQTSCDFVRMLSSRLDETNGVFQLYVNPDAHRKIPTVLNFLEDEFDLTISAEDGRITKTG